MMREKPDHAKLVKLEQTIGYHFKNSKLLLHALTHSSYAHEMYRPKLSNNERLEFLGDAVLELISSEYLYSTYPEKEEGDLTKLRASLVCEVSLAESARQIGLGEALLLGRGEDLTGGRERDSVLSDAFEAVIGAMYLDGGFTSAKEFVLRFVLKEIENKKLFFDSKTILQEIIQNEYHEVLRYELISEEGPDHNKRFYVQSYIGNRPMEKGAGNTKKAAEQNAAYQSLLKLKEGKYLN